MARPTKTKADQGALPAFFLLCIILHLSMSLKLFIRTYPTALVTEPSQAVEQLGEVVEQLDWIAISELVTKGNEKYDRTQCRRRWNSSPLNAALRLGSWSPEEDWLFPISLGRTCRHCSPQAEKCRPLVHKGKEEIGRNRIHPCPLLASPVQGTHWRIP